MNLHWQLRSIISIDGVTVTATDTPITDALQLVLLCQMKIEAAHENAQRH